MTERVLSPAVLAAVERLRPADILVAFVDSRSSEALDHAVRATQVGLALHAPELRPVILTLVGAATGASPLVTATEPPDAVERALFAPPAHDAQRVQAAVADDDLASTTGIRAALETTAALDARVLVLIDGDLRYVLPEWIQLLAGPILAGHRDVALPLATRHRFDNVIGSVLLTPLLRALFGVRLGHAGGATAGVSRDAALRLEGASAAGSLAAGLAAAALGADTSIVESRLGPAATDTRAPGPSPDDEMALRWRAVLVALLESTVRDAAVWQSSRDGREPARYGFERRGEPDGIRVDPVAWLRAFDGGASSHREAWSRALGQPALNAVLGLAVTAAGVGLSARDWLNLDRGADIERLDTPTLAGAMATFHFPDDAWARVVVDAILAAAGDERTPTDLADALLPILFGRAASFVVEARRASHDEVAALVERQTAAFERLRAHLIGSWPDHGAARRGPDHARTASAP